MAGRNVVSTKNPSKPAAQLSPVATTFFSAAATLTTLTTLSTVATSATSATPFSATAIAAAITAAGQLGRLCSRSREQPAGGVPVLLLGVG